MTAHKSFAFINGAVFIFAFFKYATDCIIIERPPNPQIKAQSGSVSVLIGSVDKIFKPCVLSIRPKASAFAVSKFPNKSASKFIIGFNKFKPNKIDENM